MKTRTKTAKVQPEAKPVETKEALQAIQSSVTLDDSAFGALLNTTVQQANAAQDNTQTLGLSALVHCSANKSADRINALIKALPDSQRKNSLRAWIEMFGAVKFDQGSKQFAFDRSKRLNLWGASQKLWYKAKIEAPYEGFDMVEAMQALYARCAKKLENAKEQDNITPEQLNKFGALIAQLKTA